ncbi:hypothetical protein ACIPC1_39605 [Streptomyces sp. NPDC087263]|uniref:hypothetical protein n=1 Tax=Streptomyces sp. NPDC087263 TaxID=3365773 RepID=UPI00381F1EAB
MSARIRTAARASTAAAVSAVTLSVLTLPARADEDPCALLAGAAKEICQQDHEGGSGSDSPSLTDPTSALDPLASLANGIAKAAAWTVDQLSNAVAATSEVDFTNSSFLKTYSLVFAASTFLVLLMWIWAVIKRAIRGVPLTTALGEAIGLLWVTVLASAFTPLILYTVVAAVDGITQGIAGGAGSEKFFSSFSDALRSEDTAQDGGPFARIALSCVAILAAGVVWLEMVIRTALLYVGAALGTVVYSGLVDKELWGRVRRWVGIMAAIIMVKPIIVIVLRLANALTSGEGPQDTTAAVISGLAIIIIAIMASAMLFRMVPGMGDDIVAARRDSYDPQSRQAAAIVTRPVTGITQGINTHASRDTSSRPAAASAQASSSVSHANGGIAAHSSRPTSSGGSRPSRADVPGQDNRGGGSGN